MSTLSLFTPKMIERVERADRIAARAMVAHRMKAGLNEHELSRISGIKARDIVRYESGKHQVPMSVLFILAPVLGMDVDRVLCAVAFSEDMPDEADAADVSSVETCH